MTSTAHAEAIAPDSRPQLVKVARALVSVSDKAGIIELAKVLHELGIEIISTGGTAKAIADAGIPVIPIDEVTRFPEMMDGRVKTLHPKIHGGLLARRDLPAHVQSMNDHDIKPIDLVIVNLYPFESTIAKDGVTDAEAIEQIDIGGPSMVRSAAKNTHPSRSSPTLHNMNRSLNNSKRTTDKPPSPCVNNSLPRHSSRPRATTR